MVSLMSLWLPILLSAVLVFVASSLIHMLLKYHRTDFGKVPNEDQVMDALRPFGIAPGDYVIPHAGSPDALKTPEFIEKMTKGPVAFVTVLENGPTAMGKNLAQWFVYCIVVGIFAAYIAGHALEPGAEYRPVFRFVGAVAFIGYSLALLQYSIWYNRNWTATLKSVFDGLVYALLTAGIFGWLWPGG